MPTPESPDRSEAEELAVARCLLDKKSRWPSEAAVP